MRIIILANRGGREKHWKEIDGEPIIKRTVRLCQGHEVYITSHDSFYDIEGSQRFEPEESPGSMLAFLATKPIWSTDTVLLYGDVYYSENAIKTILNREVKDVMFFGRYGGNTIKRWGEMFAIRFVDNFKFEYACDKILVERKKGTIKRETSWELQRYLSNLPLDKHRVGSQFVEINDETDDFDKPEEFAKWLALHRKQ